MKRELSTKHKLLFSLALSVLVTGAYSSFKSGYTHGRNDGSRSIASVSVEPEGNCHFSTVGWVKVYGVSSIEKNLTLPEAGDSLLKKCQEAATAYINENIGEGEIANVSVTESKPTTVSSADPKTN